MLQRVAGCILQFEDGIGQDCAAVFVDFSQNQRTRNQFVRGGYNHCRLGFVGRTAVDREGDLSSVQLVVDRSRGFTEVVVPRFQVGNGKGPFCIGRQVFLDHFIPSGIERKDRSG